MFKQHVGLYLLAHIVLHVKSAIIIQHNGPTVLIDDGPIVGRIDSTVDVNNSYFAFQGIPYAKPPVNNLRFRPPVPIEKWNRTLNATADKHQCVQQNIQQIISGSEDCLYINVYVPALTNTTALPVMVWIHGGTFLVGNSSYQLNGPDYFMDQNIVFVAFNYRLGIFGFISTGDEVAPGNNGLKDQLLALKWVQKNIEKFGGDPKSVTVFGESAGAASISYFLQSPQSTGLFQRAILQSGTTLCLWTLSKVSKELAFDVGKALNITTNSSTVLLERFRKINYTVLYEESMKVVQKKVPIPINGLGFAPVIEPEHSGSVYTGKSHQLLSEGHFHKVPTIIGFTSNEAAVATLVIKFSGHLFSKNLFSFGNNLVPTGMNIKNPNITTVVGDKINAFYFKNLFLILKNVIRFASDDGFVRPIRETVWQQSKYAPVYFYEFAYEGKLGFGGIRFASGVGHGEDVPYFFRTFQKDIPKQDELIRARLIKLWTNFAIYGNPTPKKDELLQNIKWPVARHGRGKLRYLNINANLTLGENPYDKSIYFWNSLYEKYGHPPYDTY